MDLAELDEAASAAVRAAVEEAERESGAELVPVLAAASDPYPVADARAAAAGALFGGAAAPWLAGGFGWGAPAWLAAAAVVAGALAGRLLAELTVVRRALAGATELDRRVDAAAGAEFLRQEVFRTRDRSGILIYISLFEHRVRVIADEGVYRAVPRPAWQELAAAVAADMRRRGAGEALLDAVRRAAALVVEHGPRRRDDDRNELPDAPVAR
jgi:putative membrane protein